MTERRSLLPFLLACLAAFVIGACDENHLPPVVGSGHLSQNGPSSDGCTDADEDGFYSDCTPTDCDDADAGQTDACYACQTPNEGCPCEEDGAVAECGHVSSVIDGYVSCVMGTRECVGGEWGACSTDRIETMALPGGGNALQAISENPGPCTGNPCDPYCHEFPNEDPETEDGAVVLPEGVTLKPNPPIIDPDNSCGEDNQEAERTPLGMILMVDRSGSMSGSPWSAVTTALRDFLGSSGTDGMQAGLDFFPYGGDGCGSGNYSGGNLAVGVGLLPPVRNALINAINGTGTGGGTPMRDALNGALFEATAWENAVAGRKGIVVLVTDGLPEGCTNCDGKKDKSDKQKAACRVQEVADLAERYYYNQEIETFVIGVEHSGTNNLQYLDVIARAGSGGARDAFIVGQNSAQIEDALNAIRDHSLPCEYQIPSAAGVVDPASTTVNYEPSVGPPRTIQRVSTPGACGSNEGFFYDSGSHSILLCPATCTAAKNDLNAKISIEYQCVESCSSGSERGSPGPFDLFVMMDRSGSMNNEDGATSVPRWQSASGALRNFVYSEESAGMGMGIGYFPPTSRCSECRDDISYPICDDWRNGVSCSPTPAGHLDGRYVYRSGYDSTCTASAFVDFNRGAVAIAELPGPNKAQAKAIHYSLTGMIPDGGTPARPALEGAISHVRSFQSSNPDHKVSVVLVTDGEPNNCSSTAASVASVAASARATDGIDTYVLGVGTSLTSLHQIAQAGAGRNAFLVDSADPSAFIDAMRSIRTLSMNCSFEVPEPTQGELDYESPRLIISAGDPALPYGLARVDNQAACGNIAAWYYDDNANPKRIFLCPRSCDIARNNGGEPRVDILYECLQDLEGGNAIFEFDTRGMACPQGTVTRWSDWSWIADTPDDTYIEFFVQTGDRDGAGNISKLSAEVPLEFTRTSLNGDSLCVARANQRCHGEDTQRGGPLALRPGDVDVDTTLSRNGIDRTQNYLRVRAAMHPDSSFSAAPILREWDLQLSCRATH